MPKSSQYLRYFQGQIKIVCTKLSDFYLIFFAIYIFNYLSKYNFITSMLKYLLLVVVLVLLTQSKDSQVCDFAVAGVTYPDPTVYWSKDINGNSLIMQEHINLLAGNIILMFRTTKEPLDSSTTILPREIKLFRKMFIHLSTALKLI